MENFIPIIIYLIIGFSLKQIPQFYKDTGNILNLFVIYISLPSVVLMKIHQMEISSSLLIPIIIAWALLILSAAAVIFLSKYFKWNKNVTGSLLLLVPLGNTSFLGIPMVETFFGKGAVIYAVLYDQLGSFLALAIYGSIIIALYGESKNKLTVKNVFKKIMTFPPFIALLAAFILKPFPYPKIVINTLIPLENTLIPLVMIAVGFQLTLKIKKEELSPLSIGLTLKLLAAPLLTLLICKIFGLKGEAVSVSIFEAGMPPMVSAGALAIIANLSPSLTAALVGLGIIISLITLPLLHYIL